ncbi:AMP-binding protein [Streptosporangium canum]|uniref:AMP-binding protein n=1 Tax=Streptosporangium canum TaxID=324952 RepID=UPI00378D855B
MTEIRSGRRAGLATGIRIGRNEAGPPAGTLIGQSNVAAELAELAQRNGWAASPAFHAGDRVWSHGEVHDLAARTTSALVDLGVRPGDRVMVAHGDGIAWVAAFLGAARLGATVVPVNPELTAADHAFMTEDCQASLVVAEDGTADRFDGVPCLTGDRLLDLAADSAPGPVARVTGATALYAQYTSGTTGAPKAALHRHADLALYHRAAGQGVVGIRHDDVTLSVSKLFFAYGLGNALVFPLFSGSSAVLLGDRPGPARIEETVGRHGVTVLYAVPSAYANIAAECDGASFASVRLAVSAGEALNETLAARARDLLAAPVLDQLGSTEAGHAFCSNTFDSDEPGTIGRPLAGYELQIRDDDGGPVADGEGELWVRGGSVMAGYLNRPEQTARTLVDGWLRTGDRAERLPGGAYVHRGRRDDLEMVGGITMSPVEVERVLAEHPAVAEVVVAVVADERGASKLRAFVVPAVPDPDPARVEEELIALARRRLAPFKVPRSVELCRALPRTHTGKLRRFAVRNGDW